MTVVLGPGQRGFPSPNHNRCALLRKFFRARLAIGTGSGAPFMVSTYKKPNGETLNDIEELFNTAVARKILLSEHCIGVWKGRFPFLKGIRMKITEDSDSLKHILRMLDTCVILHNS
jgi:DDE superfamily endonuclease